MPWKKLLPLVLVVAVLLPSGAAAGRKRITIGVANLVAAGGNRVGTVVLFPVRGLGTAVNVDVSGLTPGFHGFHVHQFGTCAPPDFASAGGHHNPTGATHGGHVGDMPTILVGQAGFGFASFLTDRFSMKSLLDADGSSFVVHELADNHANIPARYTSPTGPGPDAETQMTGDSGARLACGTLRKKTVKRPTGPPPSRAPVRAWWGG